MRSAGIIDCLSLSKALRTNPIETVTDTVDQATRSRIMAAIRDKDTQPELSLRKALHARGFRYRLHGKSLPGKPDLVFPKHRALCFVHGCFWHCHPGCNRATTPQTHTDFWETKFASTVARDQRNRTRLLEAGWRVAVVWECSLRGKRLEATVSRIADWLVGDSPEFSPDSPAKCQPARIRSTHN